MAAAVALVVAAYALRAYTPDDAFISFSYAQRHAAGDGWVASAGTAPAEGFSNPLWVFLLEASARVQLDLVVVAKALSLFFAGMLAVSTVFLADAVTGGRRWAVWGAAALVAIWPPLALWAASGMENAMYGFLLVAGTLGVVREVWHDRPTARSSWWWVAAVWTRPEAFGLAAVAAVFRLTAWRRDRRHTAWWLCIVVLGLAALFAWRYNTFGEWLPNTYYAKQNNLLTGKGAAYLLHGAWQAGFCSVALLAVAAPFVHLQPGRSALLRGPVLLLAALAGAQAAFVLVVGGDWMHQFRFLTPLFPWVAVLAVSALVGASPTPSAPRRVAAGMGGLLCAMWIVSWPAAWRGMQQNRSVDITHATWQPYRDSLHAMARALGPGARVVLPELGYPSYATDLRILDPLGLASTHIAHARYERVDRLLRDRWRPDAVKVHSLVREALHLDGNRWFRDGYMLIAGPAGAHAQRQATDGWYVRRDLFEGDGAAVPPPIAFFDDALTLRQVRLAEPAVRPGDTVRHLTWVPHRAVDDWVYDVRIRMPGGRIMALRPAPLHGWRGTSQWRVGQALYDRLDVALDADVEIGTYDVALGFRRLDDESPVLSAWFQGADATPAPLPLARFEVIAAMPADRVAAVLAQARAHEDAGNIDEAWAVLALVRAGNVRSPEAIAAVARVGGRVAADAMARAWERIAAGDPGGAMRAIDRARALQLSAWPHLRDGFVERLMMYAADNAQGLTVRTWDQIRMAALAAYTDPTNAAIERRLRGMWLTRVKAEHIGWAHSVQFWRGEHASGQENGARITLAEDGSRATFRRGLPVDQVERAELQFRLIPPEAGANAAQYYLQLLMLGPGGHAVVAVPLEDPSDGDAGSAIWSCKREGDRIVLVLETAGGQRRFDLVSLAPNPWGAPFYPPYPPAVLQAAVVAVRGGSATTACEVVEVRVTARERDWTLASAEMPMEADWELAGAPDVRAHRPYEIAPPRDG